MTDWRIVPSETTPAIRERLLQARSSEWSVPKIWRQIISAAPRASEDEALVEMLVTALMDKPGKPLTLVVAWQIVRAVLKALEPPNCVPKEDG